MPSLDDIVNGADGGLDEIVLDFSGAVDFDPIPDGTYEAKVLNVIANKSKGGNPKLEWTFGITEAPHIGRQMKRHTPTTGKGSGLSKQVLKALGVDTSATNVTFKPSQAVGQAISLVVGRQKDNADYNEIKRVNPPVAKNGGLGDLYPRH